MPETRRQYDPEFKAGAVRIVPETRRPIVEMARDLGICAGTLGNWVRKDRSERSGERLDGDDRAELVRVRAQLRRDGLVVSTKSVEAPMVRQGLQGRSRRRRRGLTRPDRSPDPVPDLLRRDFTAQCPDQKWVGDFKQINTAEGPVFLATVEDLYSRRMLSFATSDAYSIADLATAALHMAAATRGGDVVGVIMTSPNDHEQARAA